MPPPRRTAARLPRFIAVAIAVAAALLTVLSLARLLLPPTEPAALPRSAEGPLPSALPRTAAATSASSGVGEAAVAPRPSGAAGTATAPGAPGRTILDGPGLVT